MAPPDPAIISAAISSFLQNAQEKSYAEKISSFEETVRSIQAENIGLQASRTQEISSLKSLHDSTKKSEADNTKIQAHYNQEIDSLKGNIKSLLGDFESLVSDFNSLLGDVKLLQDFAKKAEADNTQLQDEIAELRAQLSHTEDFSVDGESPHDHIPRQSALQPQEPLQRRSLHSRFVMDADEQQLPYQHELKANLHFQPISDRSHNRAQQQNRPLGQQYPRGVKRAHVDDTAGNPHGLEQAKSQTHQTKRSDHKRVNDEMPGREEKRQSNMEDRSGTRRERFIDYYHSMRHEYKKSNHTSEGAFIRGFIDGIPDPDYSRWFQEALKDRFPKKVHNAKRRAPMAGGRTVTLARDLTWEDVRTLMKTTSIPDLDD